MTGVIPDGKHTTETGVVKRTVYPPYYRKWGKGDEWMKLTPAEGALIRRRRASSSFPDGQKDGGR